jgi:hypothetical protein
MEGDSRPGDTVGARERICASETRHEGTPTSTEPENDLVSTLIFVQAGPDQIDDDSEGIGQTGVGGGRQARFEQASRDAGQEEPIKIEFDALQTVEDGHDILSPASPGPELRPT